MAGLLALLGLFVLGFLRSEGLHELSTTERATLAYYRDRSAYDEWISRAQPPEDPVAEDPVQVTNLEDLVDLAIDTDERVIQDTVRDRYLVQHDDVDDVYSPPVPIVPDEESSEGEPL